MEPRSTWFPAEGLFPVLLAEPRETGIRLSFIHTDRPDLDQCCPPRDFDGRNVEADVALGLRLPFYRTDLDDRGSTFAFGFDVGFFPRFLVEDALLIAFDIRAGLPLAFLVGDWQLHLEPRHISTHIGDSFRFIHGGFGVAPTGYEGIELLAGWRFARGARVYAGGELNRTSRDERTHREKNDGSAARLGIEYDPIRFGGDERVSPYVAADFRLGNLTDRVAGTAVAGAAFPVGTVRLRVEATGRYGPSPVGIFRQHDEAYVGFGVRLER